jgi:hypothetical protein
MVEPERNLDDLFRELVQTEPEPRDDLAERSRRRRISAAIDDRLAQRGDASRGGSARPDTKWRWVWAAAAAGVVGSIGGARWLERGSQVTLEREPLGKAGTQRAQQADTAGPPSLHGTRLDEPGPVDAPARVPARATVSSTRAPEPAASAASTASAPSPSAANAEGQDASLGSQNELFQSAVRATRRGDDATALAQFDELIQRYPDSPLAADAHVRKFRTLQRLAKTTEARAAAADYLARYPQGFARTEAERLLQSTTAGEDAPSP